MISTCRFCGIQLHSKADGKGWKENENECPKNPTGKKHIAMSSSKPRMGY